MQGVDRLCLDERSDMPYLRNGLTSYEVYIFVLTFANISNHAFKEQSRMLRLSLVIGFTQAEGVRSDCLRGHPLELDS